MLCRKEKWFGMFGRHSPNDGGFLTSGLHRHDARLSATQAVADRRGGSARKFGAATSAANPYNRQKVAKSTIQTVS